MSARIEDLQFYVSHAYYRFSLAPKFVRKVLYACLKNEFLSENEVEMYQKVTLL